jgi:Alginate export
MRKWLILGLLVCLAGATYAELQNVEVGGEIRIRGRWWRSSFDGVRRTRIPNFFLTDRSIGPFGVSSVYDFDDNNNDRKIVEQVTKLSVKADFTNDVAAYIELFSWDIWGEDFRSNYITGADARANSVDDVEVNQAYIEANNMWGLPLRARIGRQELAFGKSWLIGSRVSPTLPISYDGIRLTYELDVLTVDAFWAKLAESGIVEEDGDVDMYGVYATYKGIEALQISGYWFLVRDGRSINDTNFVAPIEWLEDLFGLDDYDVTNLHTVGLRVFGDYGSLDYDLELAYQFGEADAVGAGFAPAGWLYGDDGADFDAWAGDLEVGYSLDIPWQPRVFVGGAYFEGEDNRDITFMDWLSNWDRAEASVSFNRLFSGMWYSSSMDVLGGAAAMTNFSQIRAGVTAHPTETLTTGLSLAYYWVNEPFDSPVSVSLGHFDIPLAPALSFWTQESSDDIGLFTHIWVKYDYSEDLWIKVGWEHLFAEDGVDDGSFILLNGLDFGGGTDDDDVEYIYFDTQLKF